MPARAPGSKMQAISRIEGRTDDVLELAVPPFSGFHSMPLWSPSHIVDIVVQTAPGRSPCSCLKKHWSAAAEALQKESRHGASGSPGACRPSHDHGSKLRRILPKRSDSAKIRRLKFSFVLSWENPNLGNLHFPFRTVSHCEHRLPFLRCSSQSLKRSTATKGWSLKYSGVACDTKCPRTLASMGATRHNSPGRGLPRVGRHRPAHHRRERI